MVGLNVSAVCDEEEGLDEEEAKMYKVKRGSANFNLHVPPMQEGDTYSDFDDGEPELADGIGLVQDDPPNEHRLKAAPNYPLPPQTKRIRLSSGEAPPVTGAISLCKRCLDLCVRGQCLMFACLRCGWLDSPHGISATSNEDGTPRQATG